MSLIPLKVLLVEDNLADQVLVQKGLTADSLVTFEVTTVQRLADAVNTLAGQHFDAVFLDLGLPDSQGLETFQRLHTLYPELPVVVLSGLANEEMAVQTVQNGAQDYIVKSVANRVALGRSVRYAVERQKVQLKLRESEGNLRSVVECSPDIILSVDRQMRIQFLNRTPTGLPVERVMGTSVLTYVLPEYHSTVENTIHQVFETGQPASYEIQARGPDDTLAWYSTRLALLQRETQESQVLLITQDITERKQAEDKLKASEELFFHAFEYAPIGKALTAPDGHWLKVNQALCTMTGYSAEALMAMTFQDITHPDDLEADLNYVGRMLAREINTFQMEKRFIHKSGRLIWGILSVSLVYDRADRPLYFIAQIQDITERKQTEEALRRSEQKFATAFRISPDSININRLSDGLYLDINEGFTATTGYTREEVIGRSSLELNIWVDPAVRARLVQGLQQSGQVTNLEAEFQMKDGTRRTGLMSARLIEVEGEIGILSITRNITERKRIQIALQESEERFRLFMDNSPTIAWIKDDQGRHVYLSRTYENRFGVQLADWQGKTDFELWPRQVAEQFWQNDQTVLVADRLMEFTEETLSPAGERHTWWNFKFPFQDAGGQRYVGGIGVDITERQQIEEALYLTRFSVEHAADSIYWLDEAARIVDVNETACRTLGYSRQEMLRFSVYDIDPQVTREVWQEGWQRLKQLRSRTMEWTHRTKAGQIIPVEVVANYIEFRGRSLNCAFVRDLSERKQAEEAQAKLEAQLHQAQKMESIGRLAGGVAHDFNNLLTVILGYSELMQARLPLSGTALEQLEQVRLAAKRAEGLTRQLLAFSRKQMLVPVVLDLNELVLNLQKMLERLIGEDITLITVLPSDVWAVKADLGQIEQVIMNLVVNARDAMPTGGRLTLETANVSLADYFDQTHSEGLSGPGVRLTVTDTGQGMDKETQAHIFEPFFTTKEQGKGTGLGLATVYGIIKQSGGEITVDSQPGQGAAFSLYLPAHTSTSTISTEPLPEPAVQPGRETILLVEDEEVVRDFVRVALGGYGYTLLEVDHGYQALAVAQQQKEPIDLLLTDVVMPDINGRELAERIKGLHPRIKVLFMSGYTDDEVIQRGIQMAEVELMTKPFSPVTLAAKVRELLDK